MRNRTRTRTLLAAAVVATLAALSTPASAGSADDIMCPDNKLFSSKLFTDICWRCIFPIRVAGFTITGPSKRDPPAEASRKRLCSCDGPGPIPLFGVAAASYMHARLIDITRAPFCSNSLGGTQLQAGSFEQQGGSSAGGDGEHSSVFYNYMYYAFPLHLMLNLFIDARCGTDGFNDFDIIYISALDPTWSDDQMAFFLNLEGVIFSNPFMLAACMADAVTVSAGGQPIEKLYWCAGTWGNVYPFTGHINYAGSPVRESSLLATRVLAALHRRGLATKTVGDEAMCNSLIYPMLPKTQYLMSMFYPMAEVSPGLTPKCSAVPGDSANPTACSPGKDVGGNLQKSKHEFGAHYIGDSTFKWGEWRNLPGTGEDFTYDIIRWQDCCLLF